MISKRLFSSGDPGSLMVEEGASKPRAVGLLFAGSSSSAIEDAKTPCLKVMVSERKIATEQPIPAIIEDYPVVIEITGELRPLGGG
ncbi:MAG: hypothetical protein H0T11_00550 [Chthoniobacterales bacterium]|nr:hypothetical protein [Chthoniobacterales bacterium]